MRNCGEKERWWERGGERERVDGERLGEGEKEVDGERERHWDEREGDAMGESEKEEEDAYLRYQQGWYIIYAKNSDMASLDSSMQEFELAMFWLL